MAVLACHSPLLLDTYPPTVHDHIRDAIVSALRQDIVSVDRLSGGDVAEAYRVELSDGRRVFAKTHSDPPPGFFSTEAAGLRWLRQADTVAVPDVVAVSDDPPLLVLEWIEEGTRGPLTEERFGHELAQLHLTGAVCFGRKDLRTTGSRRLPNDPCANWSEFLRERRFLPLADLAEQAAALPTGTIRDLRGLAHSLETLVGPEEPPARLHGDLWAGNRLIDTDGVSWLIDPACFGGHREFDLAMMRLFGGFGDAVEASYCEVSPLATGWEDRVLLHQVVPLVVHAIKFSGPYVGAATEAIRSYL